MSRTQTHSSTPQLTIAQAAEWLQCSPYTIRRMIARGEVRAYRYGQRVIRIDPADLRKIRQPVTNVADFANTGLDGDAA